MAKQGQAPMALRLPDGTEVTAETVVELQKKLAASEQARTGLAQGYHETRQEINQLRTSLPEQINQAVTQALQAQAESGAAAEPTPFDQLFPTGASSPLDGGMGLPGVGGIGLPGDGGVSPQQIQALVAEIRTLRQTQAERDAQYQADLDLLAQEVEQSRNFRAAAARRDLEDEAAYALEKAGHAEDSPAFRVLHRDVVDAYARAQAEGQQDLDVGKFVETAIEKHEPILAALKLKAEKDAAAAEAAAAAEKEADTAGEELPPVGTTGGEPGTGPDKLPADDAESIAAAIEEGARNAAEDDL